MRSFSSSAVHHDAPPWLYTLNSIDNSQNIAWDNGTYSVITETYSYYMYIASNGSSVKFKNSPEYRTTTLDSDSLIKTELMVSDSAALHSFRTPSSVTFKSIKLLSECISIIKSLILFQCWSYVSAKWLLERYKINYKNAFQ